MARRAHPTPLNRPQVLFIGILLLPLLYSGSDQPDQLEQVLQRGSLTLLTRNGASTYYLGPDGPTGPEYELVLQFCSFLGVNLEVRIGESNRELQQLLARRQGELIAANLSRGSGREQAFNFGPEYLETSILAVRRRGGPQPASLPDLAGLRVMVTGESAYEEALLAAADRAPGITFEAREDVGIEELLQAVADSAIDVTLVDSNIYSLNRSYFPRVEIAFVVDEDAAHAWAFPPGKDRSLVSKAGDFFTEWEADGRLPAMLDEFYAGQQPFGSFDMFPFLQHVRERLPRFIEPFREAGDVHGLDWRLLAAVGYQESHWDPEASSRTGVRGIMMLTEQTALQLGVSDRLDPAQSIEGGARYLARLRDRLPPRIAEPDRTWLALAAYNLGMGHLRDARILTQEQGLNPDRWRDVAGHLGLLNLEKWHSRTRHGYARGSEARVFVENIRRYHEILVWMDTREHPLLLTGP